MKSMIVVALALVAIAAAAPQVQYDTVKIISQESDANPDGSYKFSFKTENGIERDEEGSVKQIIDEENKPHDVVVVRGQYNYLDEEGRSQPIVYYADETGFHADGPAVPKVVV